MILGKEKEPNEPPVYILKVSKPDFFLLSGDVLFLFFILDFFIFFISLLNYSFLFRACDIEMCMTSGFIDSISKGCCFLLEDYEGTLKSLFFLFSGRGRENY